jgi:hypothetical protein
MHPSQIHLHFFFPSSQGANLSSPTSQETNYYHSTLDEMKFGSFFPQTPLPPGQIGVPDLPC